MAILVSKEKSERHTTLSFVGRQILLRSIVSGLNAWTVVVVFCA